MLCLVGHKPEPLNQRESPQRGAPQAALATRHIVAAMSEAGVSRLVLMGAAATAIASLMKRFPWIKGVGVVVVFFVIIIALLWGGCTNW